MYVLIVEQHLELMHLVGVELGQLTSVNPVTEALTRKLLSLIGGDCHSRKDILP